MRLRELLVTGLTVLAGLKLGNALIALDNRVTDLEGDREYMTLLNAEGTIDFLDADIAEIDRRLGEIVVSKINGYEDAAVEVRASATDIQQVIQGRLVNHTNWADMGLTEADRQTIAAHDQDVVIVAHGGRIVFDDDGSPLFDVSCDRSGDIVLASAAYPQNDDLIMSADEAYRLGCVLVDVAENAYA